MLVMLHRNLLLKTFIQYLYLNLKQRKYWSSILLYPLFYLWHLLTLSSCTEKLGRMSVKFLSVC